MKKFICLLVFIIISQNTLTAQGVEGTKLPFKISDENLVPLRSKLDPEFQQLLAKKLRGNKYWNKLINNKKMCVGVVDIRDPYNVRYARVNGGVMMYAASLPKIAVLLAAMDALEKGELKETKEIKDELRRMISKSDNNAATRMIDLLSYEKIESVLTDPRYDFYDEEYGGGLWVGKRYAKTGQRYPDPLMGLSHAATVTQVCRFYYMLAFGKLVSYKRSAEMLKIMSDPELHHKFVNSLDKIAPNAKLFRKSGTWKNWHSDSVLVWDKGWRKYILVGLIEDKNGEDILRKIVPVIEEVLQSLK